MMAALSCVIEDDVEKTFIDLMDTNYYTTHEELSISITNFFKDTWIGGS